MKRTTSVEAGLGAIEVIAAIVILSVAMIPLMDILIRSQRMAVQVESRIERAEAFENGLEFFRAVNVGRFPQGSRELGDWTLSWQARLAHENAAMTEYSISGQRSIGLFDVDLTVSRIRADGQLETETRQIRSVGWSEFLTPQEIREMQ